MLTDRSESAAATSGDIAGRHLGEDPCSEDHIEAIRDWIKRCQNSNDHKICHERVLNGDAAFDNEQAILLIRVIDLRETPPRLLLTKKGQRARYATLSHCWGTVVNPIKTTSLSLAERMAGIPQKSMSKTLREAVIIARGLDIRFLWVDSLCIIQEDTADWVCKAALMARTYQE